MEGVQGKEMLELRELKWAIWNFFIDEFYIDLRDIRFKTSDDSEIKNFDVILLIPAYDKNLLRKDDLEKIKEFFVNKLNMRKTYHDHVDLKSKDNLSYAMVFYYDIHTYLVMVFVTYFRNNNDEFYFIDSILILKKSVETNSPTHSNELQMRDTSLNQ